jgi:hypothetical protein
MRRPMLKEKSRWSLKKPMYLDKKDKRYKKHMAQLKKNGFSDSETWSLDSAIAEFIVPRLKRFKQLQNGFPMGLTEQQWDVIVDKMIFAFEFHLMKDNWSDNKAGFDAEYEKYEEGLQLFTKWFGHLWW